MDTKYLMFKPKADASQGFYQFRIGSFSSLAVFGFFWSPGIAMRIGRWKVLDWISKRYWVKRIERSGAYLYDTSKIPWYGTFKPHFGALRGFVRDS